MSDHTKVGEILNSDQLRDAIHIAVAAVVATEVLAPAQTIGFVEGDTHNHNVDVCACELAMSVGIVDPFLRDKVKPGQRFWMFLHPNTITSLRHNWTHPAFSGEAQVEEHKSRSMEWMERFAGQYGVSASDMIQAGRNYIRTGAYYSEGGTFEGESVPEEYWDHFQIITGDAVDEDQKESFFSCSC